MEWALARRAETLTWVPLPAAHWFSFPHCPVFLWKFCCSSAGLTSLLNMSLSLNLDLFLIVVLLFSFPRLSRVHESWFLILSSCQLLYYEVLVPKWLSLGLLRSRFLKLVMQVHAFQTPSWSSGSWSPCRVSFFLNCRCRIPRGPFCPLKLENPCSIRCLRDMSLGQNRHGSLGRELGSLRLRDEDFFSCPYLLASFGSLGPFPLE